MQDPGSFLDELLAASGAKPDRLLQHLIAVQNRYSYIPDEAISFLATRLDTPPVQIHSIIEFYAFLHPQARGEYDIRFSDNITDRMLGNKALMKGMCKKLGVEPGVPRPDGKVSVEMTSCTGLCDQGPALLVNGMAVSKLTEERIHKIVGLIEGGVANAQNIHDLREFRANCDILVAVGSCAITGGIPAMRNRFDLKGCLEEAYIHGIGVENPHVPNDVEIPLLLDKVHPIHEVVRVDYFLPGCPPRADTFWKFLTDVVAGNAVCFPYSLIHYD